MKTQLQQEQPRINWGTLKKRDQKSGNIPVQKPVKKAQQNRSKPAAKSQRITITVSSQLHGYLLGLLNLGLYGTSISDVAERLICESLHGDTKRLRAAALAQNHKAK